MLEELLNSGKLKKGEKIFLLVPESSRFSYIRTPHLFLCDSIHTSSKKNDICYGSYDFSSSLE